ncbi:putative pentatricopeptide repeat-containing protein [Senna tora]|uniref:Putative pentatricopeptide repeat-containing protein n=1 Tax=Senna tora TaxID=362788 RepID=A0A834WG12_9FABA|nr:putative pentatricopeptide repeat-containing protein [Senna tora]
MGTAKLLSAIHFRPIPFIVQNSLQKLQIGKTQYKPYPKSLRNLATDLIKSYFQKGLTEEAHKLFDEMSERDVVTWTAMISGYTSSYHHTRAWTVFCDMLRNGVEPNAFTISSVLKACKKMKSLSRGTLVHGLAIKTGTKGSLYVDNALIDMYGSCDSMDDASMVFEDINAKNCVSWTTLIAGYTHNGDAYSGLQLFRRMLLEEAEANPFTFSIAVRACTSIGSDILGKLVHAAVICHGFESSLPVMNSILDMYCRCGCTSEAKQIFLEMSQKNLITWNTLIAGFERLDSKESLYIFSQMESDGFSPNCFTFTSVVAACANLAVLYCGQQLHGGIFRRGLNNNLELSNALIDMYAKCGSITDSHKIFSEMSCTNLVSWTSMMIGYGAHGHGKKAVELFNEMVRSGIKPDKVVFMAVLSACSHAGLVDEGLRYFRLMKSYYNVTPDQEIYVCVVDLLGRAGRINEAYQLMETMPFKPNEAAWVALLGACEAHRLPSTVKLSALKVLDLKPNRVGTYVMLSNLYAAVGKWGSFANLRKLMRGTGDKKEAARSWIELKNQVYSFVVGDNIVFQNGQVHEVLELLVIHMKEAGYVPNLDSFLHDLEDGT